MYKVCLKLPLTKEDKEKIYELMRASGKEPGVDKETIEYLEHQCHRQEKELLQKDNEIHNNYDEIDDLKKIVIVISILAVILSFSFGFGGYLFGSNRVNKSVSGITESNENTEHARENSIVYISENGEKYHRYSCQYVNENMIEVTKEEAMDSGFQPCKVCNP